MSASTPAVIKATSADHHTIVADLLAAFIDDPVLCWVFPDRAKRERYGASFFVMHTRRLLPHGLVFRSQGGAAVWAPPEHAIESPLDSLRLLAASLPGAWRGGPKLLRGLLQVQAKHPHEAHVYLPAIGVREDQRGKGLGSALLQPGLEHADQRGLPAYLESSNPRNVTLYERHGFKTTEELWLPNGPLVTLMWRPAQG